MTLSGRLTQSRRPRGRIDSRDAVARRSKIESRVLAVDVYATGTRAQASKEVGTELARRRPRRRGAGHRDDEEETETRVASAPSVGPGKCAAAIFAPPPRRWRRGLERRLVRARDAPASAPARHRRAYLVVAGSWFLLCPVRGRGRRPSWDRRRGSVASVIVCSLQSSRYRHI